LQRFYPKERCDHSRRRGLDPLLARNDSLMGPLARNIDKPIAGLIRDLKSRGLFEQTLVVWTTEFGRTPTAPADRCGEDNAPSRSGAEMY
jgi:hypothetical protein